MVTMVDNTLPAPAPSNLEFLQHLTRVSRLVTLGEMAAGLAHELNQPLSAIASYAMASERLLKSSGAQLPEVSFALQEISAQALRAGDIIRRLRQVVRPREPLLAQANLNELIRQIWSLVESDARLHDARVQFEPAADLPLTAVDSTQIQEVLFNVIHNAVEAVSANDHATRLIVVSTRSTSPDEIEICVADQGPGVDPNVAGRIFEPFCTTKPDGTGLGLAVSRTIAVAHHGRLEYRPNVPAGACFLLALPIVQSPS